MKINKREILLSFVLVSIFLGIIINKFIIMPRNNEKISLNNDKEKILELKTTEKNQITNQEDIILKIERELNEFLNINSINKVSTWGEDNNEEKNIEINVSGNLESLLKIEEKIKLLGFKYKLKDIKIIKNNVNNEDNNVDCTMLFKVG